MLAARGVLCVPSRMPVAVHHVIALATRPRQGSRRSHNRGSQPATHLHAPPPAVSLSNHGLPQVRVRRVRLRHWRQVRGEPDPRRCARRVPCSDLGVRAQCGASCDCARCNEACKASVRRASARALLHLAADATGRPRLVFSARTAAAPPKIARPAHAKPANARALACASAPSASSELQQERTSSAAFALDATTLCARGV